MSEWWKLVPITVARKQQIWEQAQTIARMDQVGIPRAEISKRTGVDVGGIAARITHSKNPSPVEVWCAEDVAPTKSDKNPAFYLWAARHYVECNPEIDRDMLKITSAGGWTSGGYIMVPNDALPTRIRGTPVDG